MIDDNTLFVSFGGYIRFKNIHLYQLCLGRINTKVLIHALLRMEPNGGILWMTAMVFGQ